MNYIRQSFLLTTGNLIIVLMALIFLISISTHNHGIVDVSECEIKVSGSVPEDSHQHVDCSACLIQGNVKLPSSAPALSAPVPLFINTLDEIDYLVPTHLLKLNKPSRSPPSA